MANAGANDNGSQFFFTLDRADELNKKHTIFGKVRGNVFQFGYDMPYFCHPTQPVFTCLKLTIETLQQGVKYVCSKLTIRTPERRQ